MTRDLQWFDDSGSYELPSTRPGRGDDPKPLRINDGYSQWTLRYGRDFELTEEMNKEDEADFSFVSVIESTTHGGNTRQTSPRSRPIIGSNLRVDPFDFDGIVRGEPSPEKRLVVRMPLRRRSVRTHEPSPPSYRPSSPPPTAERVVIIGVIDDAINVAHQRFRLEDGGSRVDFAWIQDADAVQNSTVDFGREWTNAEIVDVIRQHNGDDDACMAALQLIGDPSQIYRPSPLRLRSSHGTHVADLATGNDAGEADAINRRLIMVQLPALASQDTSGASLIASVMAAAEYIFSRARLISCEFNLAVPVVLNFSYGLRGGPRNGLHVLERSLRDHAEAYVEAMNTHFGANDGIAEIVMPAGNAHLARIHVSTPLRDAEGDESLHARARIQPRDRTSTYIEFWLPKSAEDVRFGIRHTACDQEHEIKFDDPTGGSKGPTNGKAEILALPVDLDAVSSDPDANTVIARVGIDEPNDVPLALRSDETPHWRILVAIAPTLVFDSDRLPAPHGVWSFRVTANLPADSQILGWIQRDEAVSGFGQRGRQAYFEDDVYEDQHRFDRLGDVAVSALGGSPSVVRRDGTVSGIATNPLMPWPEGKADCEERADVAPSEKPLLVVGGYQWRSKAGAVYSAAGSSRIEWPLVMAPTDTSRALPGILASGSRSETRVALNGTSIAAPQVVRLLADKLAGLNSAERASFDALTFLSCEADGYNIPRPANPQDELASSPFIRKERVRFGLLDEHDDLTSLIRRKSISA